MTAISHQLIPYLVGNLTARAYAMKMFVDAGALDALQNGNAAIAVEGQ
ncbi:hypothetical protein ACS78V_02885 [Yersinia enterocolitica]|nr:hypothetical protein [Yersinia enterocolitica]HDL7346984.1 hypothetical protein [Yersinia enterocolitica]HDL7952163.1 hypothetical protein [Yersinia enterocolitica]HEN3242174.1 hypothetical protein [Yersinia enterocolitica]HEN3319652.1 hypothetical protein [Yersinia enterocolitica]